MIRKKIKQAAGLTKEEIQNGVVIKYYICNSLNKTMNEKMSQAVSAQGYRLLGVMKNDLYRLNKGDIRLIKTTSETLTVILGVPSHLKSDQYEFVIFCYDENGNLTTLKDTDTDKSTITVQAKSFGYWAIGYQKKQYILILIQGDKKLSPCFVVLYVILHVIALYCTLIIKGYRRIWIL